jgi:arylsulfatase A-like enzyme
MKTFLKSWVLILSCLAGVAAHAASDQPNVIFILADDMGYGSVAANNPECTVPTPALDRLVKEGMNFTDAHSGSSVCTPTRYALLTGRYAWRTGLKTGVIWSWYPALIEPDRLTVGKMLQEKGYRTAMVGKWHLGLDYTDKNGMNLAEANKFNERQLVFCGDLHAPSAPRYKPSSDSIDFTKPVGGGPVDCGFDSWFGVDLPNMPPYVFIKDRELQGIPSIPKPKGMYGVSGPMLPGWSLEAVLPRLADEAAAFVTAQAKSDKPFFLYYSLTSTHTPIAPSKEFQGKSGLNAYGDWLMETDWAVSKVLDALDRSGQADNTLVIFSTDNGPTEPKFLNDLKSKGCDLTHQFRGLKRAVYEGGHRVPYIVRWPGVTPAGSSCEEPISLNDFMATMADLTDYDLPVNAAEDSFSILPLYQGKSAGEHPALIHHGFWGSFAIRQGDWKMVFEYDVKTKEFTRELYNMKDDVKETQDVMGQHPEVAKKMSELFEASIKNGRMTPGPTQKNMEDPGWALPF